VKWGIEHLSAYIKIEKELQNRFEDYTPWYKKTSWLILWFVIFWPVAVAGLVLKFKA